MSFPLRAALAGLLLALGASLPAKAQPSRTVCSGMLVVFAGWSVQQGTPEGIDVTYYANVMNRYVRNIGVRIMMFDVPGGFPVGRTGGGQVTISSQAMPLNLLTIRMPHGATAPDAEAVLDRVRWFCG
ncbi:hypothetical protein [Falsiroseomonas sp.]|uniref:hypothetical protein n=1 Tax=Falsiroseomonas sp. TaxID=2870721 RepID=UPI003F70DB7D